jgi:hypothetical protein
MNRKQFEHVLRAVSFIAGDPEVLVIGSQSILGSYSENELPVEATGSMEVDTAFFSDDEEETKSGTVDATIGELSQFHHEFGYYPQGVSVNTGVFPVGWRERLVVYKVAGSPPTRALCLEPHDCVLAKLVRFEEKDYKFAGALVREGLVNLDILAERAASIPAHPAVIERINHWIAAMKARQGP